jgi:uncharacterized repeat protein (TIGR04076 family)
MKKDGMIYYCCSDGARPVFFKIERLEKKSAIDI